MKACLQLIAHRRGNPAPTCFGLNWPNRPTFPDLRLQPTALLARDNTFTSEAHSGQADYKLGYRRHVDLASSQAQRRHWHVDYLTAIHRPASVGFTGIADTSGVCLDAAVACRWRCLGNPRIRQQRLPAGMPVTPAPCSPWLDNRNAKGSLCMTDTALSPLLTAIDADNDEDAEAAVLALCETNAAASASAGWTDPVAGRRLSLVGSTWPGGAWRGRPSPSYGSDAPPCSMPYTTPTIRYGACRPPRLARCRRPGLFPRSPCC